MDNNTGEEADTFNPQVLSATSGAANAGIDHPNMYGVIRAEMPPSLEDCVQAYFVFNVPSVGLSI